MKHVAILITFFALSCQSPFSRKEVQQTIIEDTLKTSSIDTSKQEVLDTTALVIIKSPTFMEFFSQFMWDRAFQKSRVEYPLNINEIEIEKDSNWLHQDFYTSKSCMPILHFDTLTYFDKDIKEERIKMCIVSFENDSGVNYSFSKKKDSWKLLEINTIKLNLLQDLVFIDFLTRFSSDSIFQSEHIQFPLTHYFADYENDYETTSDPINQDEWRHLNLVKSIENLMVLDVGKGAPYRNIFFRGIENGIHGKYTFIQSEKSWKLIKLEDYST